MTTFEQIQERHAVLEKAAANDPDSVRAGQITNLLVQIQETAVSLADETQRQTLATILAHWAAIVDQRGEGPTATTLAPYQPSALQPEASLTVSPAPPPASPPPPIQATTAPPKRPRFNWSNPPEWLLQGLTLLIIVALAIGGYYILAYYFDTAPESADLPPTTEPTVAVAELETAVLVVPATPTAILIEVITMSDAPPEDVAPAAPQRTHIVGAGDTLSTIATRYGVTIEEITAANTLLNPNQLEIGQSLTIPFPGQAAEPTTPPTDAVTPIPLTVPPALTPELVVRGVDITAVIPLYLEPSTASPAVATLSSGTFATAIGLAEDRNWYLVELADGVTRGWVMVDSAELLYPATPDDLPLLRVINP